MCHDKSSPSSPLHTSVAALSSTTSCTVQDMVSLSRQWSPSSPYSWNEEDTLVFRTLATLVITGYHYPCCAGNLCIDHICIKFVLSTSKFMEIGGRAVCFCLVVSVLGRSSTSAVSWDSRIPCMWRSLSGEGRERGRRWRKREERKREEREEMEEERGEEGDSASTKYIPSPSFTKPLATPKLTPKPVLATPWTAHESDPV